MEIMIHVMTHRKRDDSGNASGHCKMIIASRGKQSESRCGIRRGEKIGYIGAHLPMNFSVFMNTTAENSAKVGAFDISGIRTNGGNDLGAASFLS